ncbi:MAG: preprotein translocase subunit SecG [Chloroflexota bacterium]|nr:MAG: preprotein translocase subunit SecG [Chloroflexota bacterium]
MPRSPCATIRRRHSRGVTLSPRRTNPVNPALAAGQLIVSVALCLAILLQARGAGLSGAFGGDSAVYRSRRGIERRLWQFTIILIALFVLFSMASYLLDTTA